LTYLNSYNGRRFITSDESSSLLSYNCGNILFSYASSIFRHQWTVNASVQNVWNAQYQIVAYRPMPGIHYQLGLGVSLN
ncbi:MAG: hypothetical protein ABI378_07880, partial [Chitinophagaceae bacterium]